ncbi:MAG: hypothetical protein Q7J54_03435 [Candidatus Woesearchaeota archaeon]|nr:hypothetical protein [Candidatus Woesearchaeota archaeon]
MIFKLYQKPPLTDGWHIVQYAFKPYLTLKWFLSMLGNISVKD